MTYIYAYTNIKENLSRLRRMAVLYKLLTSRGIEVQMLTNDYRATSVARDLGVPSCINIQTIWDIDLVAQYSDKVIIDSPEDDQGKFEIYQELFSSLVLVSNDQDNPLYVEQTIDIVPLIDTIFIDSKTKPKQSRAVLFIGDADPKKELLANKKEFLGLNLELLLGEYFYPDYEDDLLDIFEVQHESCEYNEIISSSQVVVTYSAQSAYEAATSGANTIYIIRNKLSCKQQDIIKQMNIKTVHTDNIDKLSSLIAQDTKPSTLDNIRHNATIEDKIITLIGM